MGDSDCAIHYVEDQLGGAKVSDGKYHLREIPDGLQIFEERLGVAGIQYRRDDARAFADGQTLFLEFERDAANQHDKNAIKVIGCRKGFFSTKRYFVGYVPSEVAANIVEGGYYEKIVPRLLRTYVGDAGFVEILFQVLGPTGQRLQYKRVDPVSLPQTALREEAHYTTYVDQVKFLKQEKRYDEAIDLLAKLVAETEKEAKRDKCGVAPWYYEQLAIIYGKTKRYADEMQILERYESQPKAPGAGAAKLADRMKKARDKRDGSQD